MKREKISRVIGGIDEQYIQEAEYAQAGSRGIGDWGGIRKKIIAAAAVFVCVFAACMPSAARSFKGYFQDILRWDGAVTGATYQAAEQEVKIHVSGNMRQKEKKLLVQITFLDPAKAPYSELATGAIALGDYQVIDLSDDATEHVIASAEGLQEEITGTIADAGTTVELPLQAEGLAAGKEYCLVIKCLYGIKKAEQPLRINGDWECRFTVQE